MSGDGDYDVVIVGGGVVGCAIARRLSFTTARVALVEAADDVGEGASKGNTGIATCGADCPPGSLDAEIVTGERARAIEQRLAPSARAALHVPGDGIVDPLRLTIGYAELAARNGVAVHLDAPVTGFRMSGERITH